MVREEAALQRRARAGDELGRLPAIATDEGHGDANFTGLPREGNVDGAGSCRDMGAGTGAKASGSSMRGFGAGGIGRDSGFCCGSAPQASALAGVVAIGTAVGAVVASMAVRLDKATNVIPLGVAMGLLMLVLNFIDRLWLAVPFLILLGGVGGYLVVPMNALLQHRGHMLMGAGRSIAVQNFNEQACILGLGAFYTAMTKFGLSAFGAITIFGVVVAGTMWLIRRWHQRNLVNHKEEVEHLLDIARTDQQPVQNRQGGIDAFGACPIGCGVGPMQDGQVSGEHDQGRAAECHGQPHRKANAPGTEP